MRRPTLLLAFVIIALSLGFLYFVPATCSQHLLNCLGDPTAPPVAPWVYRPLPSMIEHLVAPNVDPFSVNMLLVDILLQVGMIAVIVPCLYLWLKRWLEADNAIIGVFVFSTVYMVALHYWFRSVGSTIEVLLVCLGLALIERKWLFLPLVVLASFNRESGLVIVGIFAAYRWRDDAWGVFILAGVWVGITAGIHLAVGPYPHVLGALGTLTYNLSNLSDAILANLIFAPLVVGLVGGYRAAPPILKRLCWVALVYCGAVVVGGAINESQRLLLPIIPLLLPVLLTQKRSTLSIATVPE